MEDRPVLLRVLETNKMAAAGERQELLNTRVSLTSGVCVCVCVSARGRDSRRKEELPWGSPRKDAKKHRRRNHSAYPGGGWRSEAPGSLCLRRHG